MEVAETQVVVVNSVQDQSTCTVRDGFHNLHEFSALSLTVISQLINGANGVFQCTISQSQMQANKMQDETKIDVDYGLTRSLRVKKVLDKKNSARPKFKKFVKQATDDELIENMGSVCVLILIGFVIFVHFVAEWEMSLDLDYSTPNTCT